MYIVQQPLSYTWVTEAQISLGIHSLIRASMTTYRSKDTV